MSESGVTERVTYDGKAILGLATAIGSLLAMPVPLLSIALAATAIVVTLQSRRSLRGNPRLAGARLGLLGFLVAVVTLAMVAGPFVISLLVQVLAAGT